MNGSDNLSIRSKLCWGLTIATNKLYLFYLKQEDDFFFFHALLVRCFTFWAFFLLFELLHSLYEKIIPTLSKYCRGDNLQHPFCFFYMLFQCFMLMFLELILVFSVDKFFTCRTRLKLLLSSPCENFLLDFVEWLKLSLLSGYWFAPIIWVNHSCACYTHTQNHIYIALWIAQSMYFKLLSFSWWNWSRTDLP